MAKRKEEKAEAEIKPAKEKKAGNRRGILRGDQRNGNADHPLGNA